MGKRLRVQLLVAGCTLSALAALSPVAAGQAKQASPDTRKLDQQFRAAVNDYQLGKYSEATAGLEAMLPSVPKSFDVHELLGLVYAAQSRDDKAIDQFEIATRLRPTSAAAHTNLASSLTHAGKLDQAAEQFRKALQLEPGDYEANHNLAQIYIQWKQLDQALPLLEAAQKAKPDAYDNGYDLALAYSMTGKLGEARQEVQSLMQQKDAGELHNLLGEIDEKDGKFVDAANEFGTAAHMDPSEDNLFDWGSELLLHRTYEPAIEVFRSATKRYPQSPRLLIGLGMALYSRGIYDESIQALIAAADLNPADPRCYLFLSKAYLSAPNQADDVISRFRRYAELQPNNALAQYYYAMSLWKGKRLQATSVDFPAVESLLRKSVELDGSNAEVHLQLGILYADQHEYAKSLPEYQRALALSSNLLDAHYRLGQYYVHAGEKDQAQQEFEIYQKLQAQHLAEVDKERAEVQLFVYSAKGKSAGKP